METKTHSFNRSASAGHQPSRPISVPLPSVLPLLEFLNARFSVNLAPGTVFDSLSFVVAIDTLSVSLAKIDYIPSLSVFTIRELSIRGKEVPAWLLPSLSLEYLRS